MCKNFQSLFCLFITITIITFDIIKIFDLILSEPGRESLLFPHNIYKKIILKFLWEKMMFIHFICKHQSINMSRETTIDNIRRIVLLSRRIFINQMLLCLINTIQPIFQFHCSSSGVCGVRE